MKIKYVIFSLFLIMLLGHSAVLYGEDSKIKDIGFYSFKNTETCQKINETDDTYHQGRTYGSANNPKFSFFDKFTNDATYELFSSPDFSAKNVIYSPLSLYFSLAQLYEGASEKNKLEFLEAMRLESFDDTTREFLQQVYYNNNYYFDKATTRLANSIWYNTSNEAFNKVNESYMETLTNYYNTEFYLSSYSDDDLKQMSDWIKFYTGDLIKQPTNFELPKDILFVILSTIYFNHKWATPFSKTDNFRDLFNNEKEVEYIKHRIIDDYIFEDDYTLIVDSFSYGSIKYYVPTEEYLSEHELYELLEQNILRYRDKEDYDQGKIHLSVPKFKLEQEIVLNDLLKSLGVKDAYIDNGNKFNQSAVVREPSAVWLDDVRQQLFFELNEEGVKATVATTSCVKAMPTAAPPMEEFDFIVNRPFIFEICGSFGEPLFVGMINEL